MPEWFRITLSSLALWELGVKTELGAFSAANNQKIHLEKPCRVATEMRLLGIGFSLLRKKIKRRRRPS